MEGVIIVGAGKRGKELLGYLEEEPAVSIMVFYDNDESKVGKLINNVKVERPHKVLGKNILYIKRLG